MRKFLYLITIVCLLFTCSCDKRENIYSDYAKVAKEFIDSAGIIRNISSESSYPIGFLHGELVNLDNDETLEMLLISADELKKNEESEENDWQCKVVVYDLSEKNNKAQKIFDKTGMFGGNGGPSIGKFEKDGKTVLYIDEMLEGKFSFDYFDTTGEKPEVINYNAECDEIGNITGNTCINDEMVDEATFLKEYGDAIKKCDPYDCLYMYSDYVYTDGTVENVSLKKTEDFVKQLSELSETEIKLPQK